MVTDYAATAVCWRTTRESCRDRSRSPRRCNSTLDLEHPIARVSILFRDGNGFFFRRFRFFVIHFAIISTIFLISLNPLAARVLGLLTDFNC